MSIFTSYYANPKLLQTDSITVQISSSKPNWFEVDYEWNKVKPNWRTLVEPHKLGILSDEEYRKIYEGILNNDADRILEEFNELLTLDKDIILLCWCRPDKFCHRHILAEWLNKLTNQVITEL